ASLPERLERAAAALREVVDGPELDLALRAAWMDRVTAFGFGAPPPLRRWRRLPDEAWVRGFREYPIRWTRWLDDEICCSANGRSFIVPAHPSVPELLNRLNAGTECRVGALVDEYA